MYGYLAHHGILGMKWGVRRFQNEDGTLNDEGQKRYDKLEEKKNIKDLSKQLRKGQVYAQYDKTDVPGIFKIKTYLDKNGKEIDEKYVDKMINKAYKDQVIKSLVGTAIFLSGAAAVSKILSKIS